MVVWEQTHGEDNGPVVVQRLCTIRARLSNALCRGSARTVQGLRTKPKRNDRWNQFRHPNDPNNLSTTHERMNMKRTPYYIMAALCLAVTLLAWGDRGQFYTADRLPSSLIKCLAQDRYGYIWIGTEYGLSRFDGYKFTNFLHDNKDTTSIVDNTITDFLVDKAGSLWIGSAKGLMRYDYRHNNFVRYPLPDGRRPRIYSLIESRRGDVLIGTAGFGLYSIKKGHGQVIHEKDYSPRDSDMFYTHIYEDSEGNLWQSSHQPVFNRFSKRGGKVRMTSYNSPAGAPVAFFQPRRNALLIVCMFGIIGYDYTTGQLTEAGYDFGSYTGNITINSATLDHQGNLYVGTSESGVLMCPRGARTFAPYTNENKSRFDLGTSFVNDIMEDKDENLWVGCYKKGLYLVNNRQVAFNSWSFSNQNFVTGSCVSSLAAGDGGMTWCTVQNSGVFGFDTGGRIVSHPASPAGTCIIYRDRQSRYWVATPNALYEYRPETGTYTAKMRFASAGVPCIADDGRGRLFVSVYSNGLYIYDTGTAEVKVVNMSQRGRHGHLCNDWIRGMAFDRQGMLWMGTSNGVCCMDPNTYTFDNYGWTTILKNIQANYLCEDENGNIIIGTDNGLYRYDSKANRVGMFPGAERLRDKQICGIVRDAQNDIWVSTTKGIWQYDHRERLFIGHINGNGLQSHEYMQGAVMHTDRDFIGFGTPDGIVTFYPEDVRNRSTVPGNVLLTNFLVDGKSIDCMSDHFELPYSQNSFTLEFSTLNYKNADNISFDYRINGGEWQTTAEGTNAIPFTKLEPGRYVIEVRAVNNGTFSKETKQLTIIVKSPWYASPLAYLVYLTVGGALLLFLLRNYERRRKADLDEQKMKFLIDATHDIRSPLTLIMGPLKKLKERLTDSDNLQDIDTIDRNAQRLLLLVNQILDERKIDKDQMHLHCQETDLVDFIVHIMHLFDYHARERNITLRCTDRQGNDLTDSGAAHGSIGPIKVWIDRINFDKVISNLLSNAMKYTFDGGSVTIVIDSDDKQANIKIIDSGIGFKNEKTDRLFERFYQGSNSGGLHLEGTGIGLNLSRSLVNMHGGKIKAYNRTDGKQGACLDVTLPLGNSHLKEEEIMKKEETNDQPGTAKKRQASKNFRILLVDDDPEIARYIAGELGDWYRFDSAPNGKEALKKLLGDTGYDLVISDVMMPEMDGVTLVKKIKANSNISDIPVILLTSKSEVENRLEGLKKGADAFLAKPFNMEELHILIDNLVDNIRRLRGKFSGALGQTEKVEDVELKSNNDQLMDRIMKCVNENLGDPDFNVEKLTEDVGISRAQLHRKMKEITGVSTGGFIRNLRLEQAARLIKAGNVNVTQVAYAVGFNNQTHFSTVFKKHFGMTPTEYYETNKNE